MIDMINANSLPRFGDEQVNLLERLCNACAVSGAEGEVRAIVKEELGTLGFEEGKDFKVDSLGNVLVIPRMTQLSGVGKRKLRVMVAAHMDEVGMMISGQEGDGLYRFEAVGGVDSRQLIGKPVWVGKDRLPGVIGAKPIHLTDFEERKSIISIESLKIDIGPANGNKVKIGDRATFATRLLFAGPSLRAKALDDRLGVATLLELVKLFSLNPPDHLELVAAFTVQEEIGLRGAQVAAFALDPDLAFVLDCTPANDLPSWDGSENEYYNTRLGAGPAVYLADRATLSDPRLVKHLVKTAEDLGIPFQFRQPGGGGTDAGAIHKQRTGIPSVSISVPGRYLHTAATIVRRSDWQDSLALVYAALVRLLPEIFSIHKL
jgi:endoglucanase